MKTLKPVIQHKLKRLKNDFQDTKNQKRLVDELFFTSEKKVYESLQ